jgi:hypothetical protein
MEAHAAQSKTSVDTLVTASLAPDMFPFAVQVYIASNMALSIAAHLGGIQPPSALVVQPGDLKTLDDLRRHVDAVRDMVKRVDRQKLVDPTAEVTWNMGPVEKKTSSAYGFLNGFAIPNMYFHVVTAYDILRNSGVEIGKTDYLDHFLGRYLA